MTFSFKAHNYLFIFLLKSTINTIALTRILETVVTFRFSGGKVYSMIKGCHTCMIKHTMHVQSLHCSTISYLARSHFHFLKRMLGKGQLRTAYIECCNSALEIFAIVP